MKNFEIGSVEYLEAQKRVKEIKGFYTHLMVYIIINLFLILSSSYRNGTFDFAKIEIYYTALFWGIGLLAHSLSVFTTTKIFGKNWEEKKLRKYMDEYKKLNK